MSDRSIEILDQKLKIYNVNAGEYLKLIGDATKTTPVFTTIVKINDINTGAISNPLEYIRRLKSFFVNQLDLRTAVEDWLDYQGKHIYNIKRNAGETDSQYSARIIEVIVGSGCSPVVIKHLLENYGNNVQILEGIDDGAFSDVSFSDCYRDFDGPPIVKAALTGQEGGMPFFFRVIMEDVDPGDYKLIIDLIKKLKAGGISFIVQID